ncbi:MAG TPA: tripartite tricarboxylate transporter TctB family protein [Casimicrobiaceae bacterium]|nr:tripartite tricarboxylate transporter TctB family protein [Casimicrobiaceae bacterium]
MKLNDAVWGALFLLLSATILFHVRNFPTIPGQNVGPALFPGVIASALAACALLLIAKGIAARRSSGERAQWITLDAWVGSPRHVLAFFVVIGVNVFYILLVDRLGFIGTGSIYLAVLFAVFGVRMRSILPLAVVITLGIHYSFYKLLKVPLPWGLLQGWAW